MTENRKSYKLLNLKYMVNAEVDGERMEQWAHAFEDWLEVRRSRFSPKIGKRSYLAWREFLAFTGKPPWEVTISDVESHVAQLDQSGLRPGTIVDRLASLSRFYDYCQQKGIDPCCETGFNPAKRARHPQVVPYEKANYLSTTEERALLESIRHDPSPMGKRDYALILMLLRTGWPAGEVRQLRWGDIRRGAGLPDCQGEGDRQAGALPPELWDAVREYLQATGRWPGMRPEEYLFSPSLAPLVRESRERAEDWVGGRPISSDELHYLLKRHAGRAGLQAKRITCHTLRHTAAMRRTESGETAEAVGAFLGRGRLRSTRAYLKKLEENPKPRLRARKRTPGQEPAPSRGPWQAQPGNHYALQHGLSARHLPEFEWLAEQGVEMPEIDWVILRYRVIMRRAMLVGRDVRTLEEAMRILKVMGIAAHRLVRAVKLKQKMKLVG